MAFPAPTGPSSVGITARAVIRRGRALIAEIWYPADTMGGDPIPYLRDPRSLEPLDRFYRSAGGEGGWRLDLDALRELRVAAVRDAAPAPGRHPVALFSHGRGASALQNTTRVIDLASHGYVVVAPDHPGSAFRAPLPDGSQVPYDSATPDDARAAAAWADLDASLDMLSSLGSRDPLAGALDLTRVCAFGRAFGGRVVALGASTDPRILAAASLGGVPTAAAIAQPFLQMNSATGPDRAREFCAESRGPASLLVVAGTGSTSYSDTPYLPWSVPPPAPFVGTIDRDRAAEIIGHCVAAFFHEQLRRERGETLGVVANRYPEVRRESWRS